VPLPLAVGDGMRGRDAVAARRRLTPNALSAAAGVSASAPQETARAARCAVFQVFSGLQWNLCDMVVFAPEKPLRSGARVTGHGT